MEKNDEHKEKCDIKNNEEKLKQSPYWQTLEAKIVKAINEFPAWEKTVTKIQKTGNLKEWLTETIGATSCEANVMKKTLPDFFKELK